MLAQLAREQDARCREKDKREVKLRIAAQKSNMVRLAGEVAGDGSVGRGRIWHGLRTVQRALEQTAREPSPIPNPWWRQRAPTGTFLVACFGRTGALVTTGAEPSGEWIQLK